MKPNQNTKNTKSEPAQTERQKFYAGTERMTFKRIMCCKCQHVGQKLECRGCGHHICLSCKEPN